MSLRRDATNGPTPVRGGQAVPSAAVRAFQQTLLNQSVAGFRMAPAVHLASLNRSMALCFRKGWSKTDWASQPLMLAATTAVFFLGQTIPLAAIIRLTQGESVRKVWTSIAQMSFPYFVLSAGVASMLNLVGARFGWHAAFVVSPVMYGVHYSYRLYFWRVEQTLPVPTLAKGASA